MTASEDRIDELVNNVPTIQRTRWQKILRGVSILCNVVAVVAMVLWVVASVRTSNLAKCTNSNLGTRSAPAKNDAQAHVDFAEAVLGLFKVEPGVTPQARADQFEAATTKYVRTLKADQAARAAHPLGKC